MITQQDINECEEILAAQEKFRFAVGNNWFPKNQQYPLPWKLTKIFVGDDGEEVYRLEKYQGGRNSPALLTRKQLNKNFRPENTL